MSDGCSKCGAPADYEQHEFTLCWECGERLWDGIAIPNDGMPREVERVIAFTWVSFIVLDPEAMRLLRSLP